MEDRTPPTNRARLTVPAGQRLLNATAKSADQAADVLGVLVAVLSADQVDVYELHVHALALVQVARALAMTVEDLMVEVAA